MTKIFYYLIKFFDRQTEKKIHRKLRSLLGDKISVLIDVGFYLGEYYKNISEIIHIENVFGFEANPETYSKIKKKFEMVKSLKVFNIALGHENSEQNFNVNYEPSSSSFNLIDKNSTYFKKKNRILNFFGFKKKSKIINIKIKTLKEIIKNLNIEKIDLIKIDTEGYEYNIIKGLGDQINNVKVLHFEHHFDNMLMKNYKFSNIHNYLLQNNFKKIYKIKMKFRKSFEYIYINKIFFS